MKLLSLFSGIDGFDTGFARAGMKCIGKAEQDRWCNAVSRFHSPKVKRVSDVKEINRSTFPVPDIICAGVPCQDVSIAGKRAGLGGTRTRLFFEFSRIVEVFKPQWLVFENVPGLFSANERRDFARVLGELGECGYMLAYRILDSEYFGVAQRRRRVFIVGSLGNGSCAEVLFESESLCRDPAEGRKTGTDITQSITGRLGGGGSDDNKAQGGFYIADRAAPISAKTHGRTYGDDELSGNLIAGTLPADYYKSGGNGMREMQNGMIPVSATETGHSFWKEGKPMLSGRSPSRQQNIVTHSLKARADGSEDGTGRGTPIIAFSSKDNGRDASEISPTLRSMQYDKSHVNGGGQVVIAFTERTRKEGRNLEIQEELSYALTNPGAGGRSHCRAILNNVGGVRRLTPRECERLQGFPDDYTRYGMEDGKKIEISDTQRYRMLGNAVTVSVSEWIGKRLMRLDRLKTG